MVASPLECAVAKNCRASPLGSTVANSLDLKPRGMNSYGKVGWWGALKLSRGVIRPSNSQRPAQKRFCQRAGPILSGVVRFKKDRDAIPAQSSTRAQGLVRH